MSQTKVEFCLEQIEARVKAIIERESIPSNSESYDDLQWIKFYAKDIAPCKECADQKGDTPQNNT